MVTAATSERPTRLQACLGVAGRLLDVLAPPSCAACALPGDALCARCRAALVRLAAPLCERCGHPVAIEVAACPACPPALDHARQAVAYEGPAPPLVAALKDRRRRALARLLADLVLEAVGPPGRDVVLVPVPLHPRREAARGFNQSLLLAEALGSAWERPVLHLLERRTDGPSQRGAGAAERARQVAGAFRPRAGGGAPARVWIVDDVHTTGATLAACARVLRRAGAREVGAVCFARAIRGHRSTG